MIQDKERKTPLNISVSRKIVDWVESNFLELKFRNKSHLVEQAIKEFIKKREYEFNLKQWNNAEAGNALIEEETNGK